MRTRVIFLRMLLACFCLPGVVPVFGQEQDDDVRGAFLTTRPKVAEKSNRNNESARANRRRPKRVDSKSTTSTSSTSSVDSTAGAKVTIVVDSKPSAQKIGLGLTLFARNDSGMAVQVDPTHVFHKGDRVRVLLETNTDGYLYIFNTTDGGKPVMIYPDKDLDEGGNYIQSHIPLEIPSSAAREERLRWLAFDDRAGDERLYFVFTREPLPGVPIEDEFLAYCRGKANGCSWQPASELWEQVQKEMNSPVLVAKTQRYGRGQTAGEQQAATRGIGLSKEDPGPSMVMLTTSTNKNLLVAVLDLIHKPAGSN